MDSSFVQCQCGAPCSQFTVKKPGPNQGRPFFTCAHKVCKTFIWGDEEKQESTTPVCKCNQRSIKLQVKKDGPNQGRYFYKCKENHCNFFEWALETNEY
jgi:DNA topoisomerase-3